MEDEGVISEFYSEPNRWGRPILMVDVTYLRKVIWSDLCVRWSESVLRIQRFDGGMTKHSVRERNWVGKPAVVTSHRPVRDVIEEV